MLMFNFPNLSFSGLTANEDDHSAANQPAEAGKVVLGQRTPPSHAS